MRLFSETGLSPTKGGRWREVEGGGGRWGEVGGGGGRRGREQRDRQSLRDSEWDSASSSSSSSSSSFSSAAANISIQDFPGSERPFVSLTRVHATGINQGPSSSSSSSSCPPSSSSSSEPQEKCSE
uniref:Uncharacterized protein n=1 Tax=Knipowitschia caucasica TaxID=637954 RepID=A0AAV2MEF4_KNICA